MNIRLYNIHGLALRLSTSAAEVQRLIDANAFPVVELPSGEMRIDPRDVEAWIEKSKYRVNLSTTGENEMGITARQRLAIVRTAQNCIAELPDRTVLSAERIADSVIKGCGGDLTKVNEAFAAYKPEAIKERDSIVERILNKRRAR